MATTSGGPCLPLMELALQRKSGQAEVVSQRRSQTAATPMEALEVADNGTVLPDLRLAAMLCGG